MSNAIIIFIKNAEKGKVKTRIAKTVGDDQALKIYLELLRHTRQTTQKIKNVIRYVFYSKSIEPNDDWSTDFFKKDLQFGSDLGERMKNAFKQILIKHSKAIIIGSDCASLQPDILNMAFDYLENNDFVVGPALDGGYYLIGMKKFEPSVFDNIEWSAEKVFSKTIENIIKINKSYALLPALSDIDTEADWVQWGW